MATNITDLMTPTAQPVTTYTLPAIVAAESGFKTIGVKQLTAQDELNAGERCRGNAIRLATELAKAALAQADGAPLQFGDGTVDIAWEKLGGRGRSLVMVAFNENTSMADDDVKLFLASRTLAV